MPTNQDLFQQASFNELFPNKYCRFLNINHTKEEAQKEDDLKTREGRGMPCMTSGQRLCFPSSTTSSTNEKYNLWWEKSTASSPKTVPLLQQSILNCSRTEMSFEAVETCHCQHCGYQTGGTVLINPLHQHNYNFASDIPRPIRTCRHGRIFSPESSGILQTKLVDNDTDGKTHYCDRVELLSDMHLHFSTIGTAFNLYHVLFDLLQPLYSWAQSRDQNEILMPKKPSVLILSIGNVLNGKDVEATIALATNVDLPLYALLATVLNGDGGQDDFARILSKHQFDSMVEKKLPTQILCVNSLWIGHTPTGFVSPFTNHTVNLCGLYRYTCSVALTRFYISLSVSV